MARTAGYLTILLALGYPAATAAATTPDRCAALDYLLAQARTEFPKLAHKRLDFGRCRLARQEFECAWEFPTYAFAAAQDQAAKLTQCTAAQPGARKIEGSDREVRFQLNPETTVSVAKPLADGGNWKLKLQITSTAEWK